MFRLPLEKLNQLYLRAFDSEFLRRIARNSSYLVSSTVIVAALGMVQNSLQARSLDLAGLGLLAAIASYTNVINRFTSFRIDELVIKYVRLYEECKEHQMAAAVYKLAAMLEVGGSIVAFIIIAILSPLAVEYFSDVSGVEGVFVLYGSIVLINGVFDSSDGLLQVFNRFDAKSAIDIAQSAVRLVLTFAIFLAGGGLMAIVIAELAGRLLRSVAVSFFALRMARENWGTGWWRTPISVLKEDRRSLLTFAFSTNLSATVSLIAKDSEGLWVNAFLGNVAGGVYSLALTLIGFLQIPISPLPSTTYPELSRAVAQGNWQAVRSVLQRGSLLAALYSIPVALVLVLFGRELIVLYTGPNFLPTYEPLVVLLIGYTFGNIFYWNRAALLAFNRPIYPTLVNFTGMILKIIGIFMLASYGAIGFAAVLSFYYIYTVGLAVLRVRRDLRDHLGEAAAV